MTAFSSPATPRLIARILLFELALAMAIVAMPVAVPSLASSAYAPPCPGDPPPPPPQPCGDQPCPSLPSTGGGGAACDDDPSDPACQGGSTTPRAPIANLDSSEYLIVSMNGVNMLDAGLVAAHPCPGDPSPGGTTPELTPVPLIPVCAACEAPDVAASVEMPAVQVRMNPETGLVNLPTWLWAEGYRGQDLFATRSWSPPYEPTTIEVRFFVKRYLWNFGDGGQIESKSLGQPYPAESDITNAYAWPSRTEPGGHFHLALIIEWNVEYRVNGGTPQALPPATRRYEAIHPVQELQPVITTP